MLTINAHEPRATSKADRQAALIEIVSGQSIKTQAEIVAALQRAGIACTQASVSRDIRELGLVKRDGHYQPPDPAAAGADLQSYAVGVSALIREVAMVGEHLVVVHTLPGTADGVGVFIDGKAWPGVVGTVAGDDTLFAAVVDRTAADRLVQELVRIRKATP